MRKLAVPALLVAVLLFAVPGVAHAQGCAPGAFRQFDMAGSYESSTMRAMIHPCGGVSVAWENYYGVHAAGYGGMGRLEGNGIMAYGRYPDPMTGLYLDGSVFLGIKAAEPGFVQLVTYGPSPDPFNMPVLAVYRLRKVT